MDWQSDAAVQYLLARNAQVNALDVHSNTPLHKIDAKCQTDAAYDCLRYGVRPTRLFLMCAYMCRCRRVVARLTRGGADVSARNEFGRKPLDHFDLGKATVELLPEEEAEYDDSKPAHTAPVQSATAHAPAA